MYERGVSAAPRMSLLYNGLSMVRLAQAADAWQREGDPDLPLAQAITAATQAIAVAPEQGFGYNNLGAALSRLADFQRLRRRDPRAASAAATAAFTLALARIPDEPTILANQAAAALVVASWEVEQGVDPRPRLALANRAIDRAIAQNPAHPRAFQLRAAALSDLVRWQDLHAQAAATSYEAVAGWYRRAIELAPDQPDLQLEFGMFARRWAVARLAMGTDPGVILDESQALAERLCAARPGWAAARALRAGLQVLRGQRAASSDAERALAKRAADELARLLADDQAVALQWRGR